MGWTAPRTWVTGEIPTAAIFNTHVRDNLDYLKTAVDGKTQVTAGSYSGNDSANRGIAHGLSATPSWVFIYKVASDEWFQGGVTGDMNSVLYMSAGASGRLAVTVRDATNFYVGNSGDYPNSANSNGVAYRWIAFL